MLSGLIGSIIGAGADIGLGLYNAHHSAKEARAADERQYRYALRSARELPAAQRQGLEAAGYNPMLALGSIGGVSSMPSHQGTTDVSFNGSSAKALGEFAEKLMVDKAKAEVDNIKANTERTEAELGVFDAQKARLEAETSLAISQAERSDLAYGRDIVDTITGIAGTGASLYSAKAMSDVAKANSAIAARNATVNERNATVNERKANTQTYEVRRDAKGRKVGEIQRSTRASGIPSVSNSANPNVKPNATPQVGSSVRSAGKIAKEVAEHLLWLAPLAVGAYGVGKLQENADRSIKSDPKSNYSRGYKHFVPRLGL